MALSGNPDTLDPHKTAGTLTFQSLKVYTILFWNPSSGKSGPSLAERWEFQDGDKTLIFYLRRGVKFHDGTGFTSRDVEKHSKE
jgi:peptide/nickel transport system substrate-binding protein